MVISWLGQAGIKLQVKDTILIIDPPDENGKGRRLNANIVALSAKTRGNINITGEPFVIDEPGEYERQNVFVYGLHLPTDPANVHWRLEAEDLSLGHLGHLNHKLENGELAQLEGVDILFVPVGGHVVLNGEQAAELISQIEPRIVIPIQFKSEGIKNDQDSAEKFLKEMGAKAVTPTDKFRVGKKDLPAEETQVVVLSQS